MFPAVFRSALIALVSTALTVVMTAAAPSPGAADARPHLAHVSAGLTA